MPLLIDGHNLIGAYPGLSLADPDDEQKLLDRLWSYARLSRRRIVVFFDQGDPLSRSAGGGMVTARFIPLPRKADDAILDYLRGRKDARRCTVVTSDAEVRERARRAGAKVIPAGEFARAMQDLFAAAEKEKPPDHPEGIDDWLQLFGSSPPRPPA